MILVNSDDYNKDEDKGGDSVVVGEIVLESSDITSTATATITTSLLSLSNHLLVYIFQYVLEPLEFKCCNQSAAGFKTRVLGNYCYIDSYHNVNNILIRYGTICKRFCNAIVPKLTRHLQLFIQDGLDLWRMVKLSRYGLLKDNNHNGNNGGGVQFGHIEISRYSRVSQHGLMAAMGVDLPVITDCASLRSVQSLTIESLLSTPSFLISLMSNTSLTRLSLSTGQFAIADYQNLVTMISRISTSLSSLKLFNPLFLNNGNNINNNIQSISLTSTSTTSNSNNINSNIDFIELLTKHYEDSTKTTSPPHSYGNLLNLSLTGYSRDSVIRLLSLPGLSLVKLKLYGLSQPYNDKLSLAISKIASLQSLSCCSIDLNTTEQPQRLFHRRLPMSLNRLTKLHLSKISSPFVSNPLPIQFASLRELIIHDISLPESDIVQLFATLHQQCTKVERVNLENINILTAAAVEHFIRFIASSKHLVALTLDSLYTEHLLRDISVALKDNCPKLEHLTFKPYFKSRMKVIEEISRNLESFLNNCKTLQTFSFYKINFPSYVIRALLGHAALKVVHIGRMRKPLRFKQLLNDNRSIHTLKCTQLDGTNQDILEILHSQSKLPTKTLESLTLSIVISCSKLMKYLIDLMFNHTSSDSGSNSNNSDYISNLSLKIDPYCQDESLLQLLSYLKIVNNNSNNSNNVQLEQKQQQQQHRKTQLETLTIERISSLKQPKCYHMIHSLLAQQNNNVLLNLNHHQQQQILLQQDHIDILIPQHSQQQQEEFIHIYLQKNLKSDWELSRLG